MEKYFKKIGNNDSNSEISKKDTIRSIIKNKYRISDSIVLTDDQIYALNCMDTGLNIFLTGAAGTGKSKVIEIFYNKKIENDIEKDIPRIYKTSTTGISALNIGGKTLHSWAGIGLGEGTAESLASKMNFAAKQRIIFCRILIIDEISMLNPIVFDKVNRILQIIRNNEKPFGGIQVILCGDLLQLPVVKSEKQCFEAESWNKVVQKVVILKEIVRQSRDPVFQKILEEVRYGFPSRESIELLESRLITNLGNQSLEINGIIPTRLFPKNKDVDTFNRIELNKLLDAGVETKKCKAIYRVAKNNTTMSVVTKAIEYIKKETEVICPDELTLCVGAQMIIKKNIPPNLANGTRCVITKIVDGLPEVTLLNGVKAIIPYNDFEFKNDAYTIIKQQIPMKYGWATSIHASQGLTLDYVEADIGSDIFSYGQTYVVLSRVRSLDSLVLTSFDPSRIMANPKVISYLELSGIK